MYVQERIIPRVNLMQKKVPLVFINYDKLLLLTSKVTQAKAYTSLAAVLLNSVKSNISGLCSSGAIHLIEPALCEVLITSVASVNPARPKSANRTCQWSSMKILV